jgi:hypothetical protein
MLRFTSRARTGNIRGLKLTPYLIRGMLGKVGGGGPIDFFKERKLREIASGRRTTVEDTTRVLSKLFFTPSGSQSFSRFLGNIFDEDYTRSEVLDARKKLRQMYGDEDESEIKTPKEKLEDGDIVPNKSKSGKGQKQVNDKLVKLLNSLTDNVYKEVLENSSRLVRLNDKIQDIYEKTQSEADDAAKIASSTSRNVLESLTMLQQLVTQRDSSDVDADQLFKRIYDLETYQKLILIQLQKKPKSRAKKAKDEGQLDLFGESKLDSEQLVKIIEKNTIEDMHKILVERRPDRTDELNQILDAIAKKKSTLDIEEDELKEILTQALIEALKKSDCCGKDSSIISDILQNVLPIGKTLTAIRTAVSGVSKSVVSTLAKYAPKIFTASGLALAGAGTATAAIVTGIGGAEGRFVDEQNKKIAPYGIQVVGKNAQNQFVYEDFEGKTYTRDNLPQKYMDVLEGFSGDTRSKSSQEARKRVESNKNLYRISEEPKPEVSMGVPPTAAQMAPSPVLQEQTKNLVEQSASVIQKQSAGNNQPIVTNVYNSTVNNLPPKEKIKISNNENTYTRLTYQDMDFPQTYGNLNMG